MSACRACHIAHRNVHRLRAHAAGQRVPDSQINSPDEYFFNLSAAYCPRLHARAARRPAAARADVQRPLPLLFGELESGCRNTSAALARDVIATLPSADPFVVEIGSNDGTLLRHVAAAGHPPSRDRAVRKRGGRRRATAASTRSGQFFDAGRRHGDIVAGARPRPRDHRGERALARRRSACRRRGHRDPAGAGRHVCHRGSVLGRRRRPDRVRSDLRRARLVFHAVVAVAAVRSAWPRGSSTRLDSTSTAARCVI